MEINDYVMHCVCLLHKCMLIHELINEDKKCVTKHAQIMYIFPRILIYFGVAMTHNLIRDVYFYYVCVYL